MLSIAERAVGDVTVLELSGRLALSEGEAEFRRKVEALVAEGRLSIIVDVKMVTYIDSAGVGALVAKFLSVRRAGGHLKLLHMTPRSIRLMSITRLQTVFEIYESEEEAIASFAAS
jgi:anti-sigma B factor antagonist